MADIQFETYVEKREEIEAIQFRDQSQAAGFAQLLGSSEHWTLNNFPEEEFELVLAGGRGVLHRGDYVVRTSAGAGWVTENSIVSWQDFRDKWQKKA